MTYLLDTDTSIYIITRRPAGVLRRLHSCAVEQIAVSAITVAQLQHGAAKSQQPDRNRHALMQFLLPFSPLMLAQ